MRSPLLTRRAGKKCAPPIQRAFIEMLENRQLLAVVPAGFTDTTLVSGSIKNPTTMAFAPDGRLFIAEQGGNLKVFKNGNLNTTPFLKVTTNTAGERGLMGVTFDPDFNTNRYVYIYYTATTPAYHNRISRFTANGDVAVAGSEKVIMELPNLVNVYHNSGAMRFGPDGKLYVAVGDNTVTSNAQSLSNPLGKILRINKDGTIPTDNPYYNTATGQGKAIWAMGLRNPFTFAFQPGTGRMFINDVGEDAWEEIDEGKKGANYGWPSTEGDFNQSTYPNFTRPLYAYGHDVDPGENAGGTCAITGGVFYDGGTTSFPSQYDGKYFFMDYCANWISVLNESTKTHTIFASQIRQPVGVTVGPDGAMYYLSRSFSGLEHYLGKITYTGSQAPSISTQPQSKTASVGSNVTFTVAANGAAPLSYQWQRNNFNISGANSSSYTLNSVQLSDSGDTFRCIVSNASGSATSNNATLTVTSSSAPKPTISTPPSGTLYSGGQTINFSGSATDPQDGNLPGSALTWEVRFFHDEHSHPFTLPFTGTGGSFTAPTIGDHKDANVFFRISLTAKDSSGLTTTVTRDIQPRKSTVQLKASIAGLSLTLDGQTAPASFVGVEGVIRSIGAPSPQTINGTTYVFDSWSDGGVQTHDISTPVNDTTYTANFKVSGSGGGNGLNATYYNNLNFTGTTVTRVDPTVNFNFDTGSPAAAIGPDTFSARWTGFVQPQYTQTYTFYTFADDGTRLWVNNKLLVDHWVDGAAVEKSGTIALEAGKKYSIKLEYYENIGKAKVNLQWSSSSQAKQIIPSNRLFTSNATSVTLTPTDDATVRGGTNSSTNYGGASKLEVKHNTSATNERQTYLKFNIGSVAAVTSAKLRLFGGLLTSEDPSMRISVYSASNTTWTEGSINYGNKPGSAAGSSATTTISGTTAKYYEWDLTSLIAAEKAAGHTTITLVLKSVDLTWAVGSFNSSEASSNKPQLVVS